MARRFEDDLNQARSAQQSLGTKMAGYVNGPNLDNTGKGVERKQTSSKGGAKERPLVSNDRAPSGGRSDKDQAAARSSMRGINISKTINLNPPGGDSHITGKVGGKAKRTKVKDWKDPGGDPTPQQGTAITKLTRLAVPIVRPIRAESASGATSFHFSHEAVTKTKTERVSDSGRRTRPGSAKDHAAYIERDGAVARADGGGEVEAETLEKDETDPEKIAAATIAALIAQGEEKSLADVTAELGKAAVGGVYIERQEAMAHEADGAAVLYSNIAADPAARRKFWELVEEHEKKPGEDAMRIRAASNPQLWLDVVNDPDCPEDVIKTLEAADPTREVRIQTGDNDHMRALMLRHGWTPPKRSKVDGLSQEEQEAVDGQQDKAKGIVFEDARGGRIQYRIIGELPHEVDHAARVRIVRGFAQEFEKRNLPYVAVMHAPDHTNNDKNWHFHLIYHDRPSARFTGDAADHVPHVAPNATDYIKRQVEIAEQCIQSPAVLNQVGQWDFTVKATYKKQGKSGNIMTTFPYAQAKSRECNKQDFVPKLRKVLADITNEELEAIGHRRRLDPRKYTEIGIERQPDQHLGTRAAQHETSGISTDVGRQNERNQWAYQMTQIHRYQEAEEVKLRGDIAQMRRVNQAIVGDDPRSALLERHVIQYEQLRRAAIEHEVIARMMQENIDRAASRANKVKLTCEKHLKAMSAKKATKRQITHKSDYENKLKEAVIHLTGLQVLFQEEAKQIGRSEEQAKLLQGEAKEAQDAFNKIIKEVQAELGIPDSKVEGVAAQTQTTQARTIDQSTAAGNEGVGALTKKQIDAFIDTVFKENIRLVRDGRKIVPAVEDPRFAAIVTAPNYASFQARLKGILDKQTEAIDALLKVLDNKPEAVSSITGPDGKAIVTLKIDDKRLQAALQSYQDDKRVSRAIDKAIVHQKALESLKTGFQKPAPVGVATLVPPATQPAPVSAPVSTPVSVQVPTPPPAPKPVPYPFQDLVRTALFERSLSGTQWDEVDGKKFLILTDASSQRLKVPKRVEIAPDVVPVIEKTIAAADREELRLRAYIEKRPSYVQVSPLRILMVEYANAEMREIAKKHSNDPERRALYAAIPKLASKRIEYTLDYINDMNASEAVKADAKAARERTEYEPIPEDVRRKAAEPLSKRIDLSLYNVEDKGVKLKTGIHPKLDEYLMADARGDLEKRRLIAEAIVADREVTRVARKLTRADQEKIKGDSQYNRNTKSNQINPFDDRAQEISRQMDRGIVPESD